MIGTDDDGLSFFSILKPEHFTRFQNKFKGNSISSNQITCMEEDASEFFGLELPVVVLIFLILQPENGRILLSTNQILILFVVIISRQL